MPSIRLVLALIVSTMALASAQSTASNASTILHAPSNASTEVQSPRSYCTSKFTSIHYGWYYDTLTSGPYECYGNDYESWAMMPAYRSGGTEWVHWKYTEDANNFDCVQRDWKWFAEDGKRLIAHIRGTLAVHTDGRHWCAMRVYRSGGVEGNQWEWCNCWH